MKKLLAVLLMALASSGAFAGNGSENCDEERVVVEQVLDTSDNCDAPMAATAEYDEFNHGAPV